MKSIKTLIIGASFFAAGYAATHQDCLIVERRETLGFDFVGCADMTWLNTEKSYGTAASKILSELKNRGLTDDTGKVSIFPVSSVLAKYILENNINLLLATETVSVEKSENGFEITVFGPLGYDTVFAEKVIDTREILPDDGKPEYKKFLNATVIGDGAEFAEVNGFSLKHGLYGISALGMEVDSNADYSTARRLFCEKTGKLIKDSRVAAFALDFKYKFFTENICRISEKGIYWIPSASYDNFLDAFEEGCQCGI